MWLRFGGGSPLWRHKKSQTDCVCMYFPIFQAVFGGSTATCLPGPADLSENNSERRRLEPVRPHGQREVRAKTFCFIRWQLTNPVSCRTFLDGGDSKNGGRVQIIHVSSVENLNDIILNAVSVYQIRDIQCRWHVSIEQHATSTVFYISTGMSLVFKCCCPRMKTKLMFELLNGFRFSNRLSMFEIWTFCLD